MSHARRRARAAIVQALYQWHMTRANMAQIDAQFKEEHAGSKTDIAYFEEVLRGILLNVDELDGYYKGYVDRTFEEINPVELAVLRLAAYEMKYRLDIPYRVVINEAVDLSKKFGSDQAHRFINGLVDKMAKDLRKAEIAKAANS